MTMYKIVKDKNNIIQDSIDNVVIDPELKEKLNGVSSLTYSIPFNDKYYDDYQEMKTIVDVIGENESNPEFVGRLISIKKKFNGNKELTFEGELAYLNDVQYPPFSFSGSPEELFTSVLDYYNSKCSESKKILKGNVTVTDANDYIVRENQDYSSCWTVISEKLIKSLGGYIKLRYLNGKRYLDYLLDSGNVSNQNIEFGKNLLDLEDYIDASQVATVIIPLGAKDENTGERINIESVNDGKNYIESSLISKYGRIEKVVIWDDVTLPENLLKKANKELGNIILANKTITTKAIDLHFSSDVIDSFKIGNIINCISKPHNLNVQMILTERTRKLNDPVNDSITLGTESKTLTDSINDTAKKAEENESKITGNWLQKVIEDNTKTLLGGSGGYIYVHYLDDNKKHPDAIYIMDCESTSEAKNVILINKNGIGYSTNGIDGPFTSAWTIDGRFNADLIQANSIDVNQLKSNVGEELNISSNKSIKLIVQEIAETNNSVYLFEAGSGNIFDNCNQYISKDYENLEKVQSTDMPLGINIDYLQGKDICISVGIFVKNGIVGSLDGYCGAEFDIGFSDGTKETYAIRFYVGQLTFQYVLNTGALDFDKRIYAHYKIPDKEITSVSNLRLCAFMNAEKIVVSYPKVEFGTYPTGFEFDNEIVRDSIVTLNKEYTQIVQNINELSLKSVSLTEEITTIKGDVSTVQTRLQSTEIKLQPTNILMAVNEKIGVDGQLYTTKFILDKNGVHINGGGLDISNNVGTKVFYADINGNLVLTGTVNANNGVIGGWTVEENGFTNGTAKIDKNGVTNIYTWADLYIIRLIIMGTVVADSDMIDHYDFNGDGSITSADYMNLKNKLKGL